MCCATSKAEAEKWSHHLNKAAIALNYIIICFSKCNLDIADKRLVREIEDKEVKCLIFKKYA